MSGRYRPLAVKQGDSHIQVLQINEANGVVSNLTGATVTFYLRPRNDDTTVLEIPLVSSTPTSGQTTLTIPAADTEELNSNVVYDYEVILARGAEVRTIVLGGFFVLSNN